MARDVLVRIGSNAEMDVPIGGEGVEASISHPPPDSHGFHSGAGASTNADRNGAQLVARSGGENERWPGKELLSMSATRRPLSQ
jgi:hypothetical protein